MYASISDRLNSVIALEVSGISVETTPSEYLGDVVQLVRMLPCHGRGRGFEPRRPRHKSSTKQRVYGNTIKSGILRKGAENLSTFLAFFLVEGADEGAESALLLSHRTSFSPPDRSRVSFRKRPASCHQRIVQY